MTRIRSITLAARGKAFSGRGVLAGFGVLGVLGLSLLTGCGVGTIATGPSGPAEGAAMQGRVHGGRQPVGGAQIALYAASTTGYPDDTMTPNTPLVTTNTDAGGSFTLPAYTCPAVTGGSQLYIIAVGGNPGNPGTGSAANNPNLVLMSALGPCPSGGTLSSTLFVDIDEVSTVASAYALAPFMTYPGYDTNGVDAGAVPYVGTSSTNTLGLKNAFATATNLYNVTSGQAYSVTPAYASSGVTAANASYVPQARINTLANILAACINSTGGTAGDDSTNCGTLFDATTTLPTGGFAPTDTLQAILNLAQAPGGLSSTSSTQLYGLQSNQAPGLSAPYSPALTGSAPPNDWALALGFTGGGFGRIAGGTVTDTTHGSGLAIDASGNIWAASGESAIYNVATGPGFVAEFNNLGVPLSPTTTATTLGGYQAGSIDVPWSLAVDPNGNVWVGNSNSSVSVLNQSGTQQLAPVTGGGMGATVTGIAIDTATPFHVWTVGSSAGAQFNSDGTAVSNSKYDPGNDYLASMGHATFDSLGDLFAVDTTTAALVQSKISAPTALTKLWYSTSGPADDVVADSAGNVFSMGAQGTILKLNPSTLAVASTFTYVNPATTAGSVLALDGAADIWVAGLHVNSGTPYLHELNATGQRLSPAGTGFTGVGSGGEANAILQNVEAGVAVDGSGNVWVLNPGNSYISGQPNFSLFQLVEFVGLGQPVVTPTSVALRNGKLATRP